MSTTIASVNPSTRRSTPTSSTRGHETRHDPLQCRDPINRERETGDAAYYREREALGEKLRGQPRAARSERGPDRDFGASPHALGHQEIRDVRAREEEDEAHGPEEHEESLAGATELRVEERSDGSSPSRVGRRKLLRETEGERVHLRPRLLEGLPFREAGDHSKKARPSIVLRRVPSERAPHFGLPRIVEPGRSDADDDVLPPIEENGPAQKAAVGAVSPFPEIVPDDHHGLGAVAILARREGSSFDGVDTHHGEEIVGHIRGRDALWLPVVPGEIEIRIPPSRNVVEAREIFPEVRELDRRDVALRLPLSVVHLANGDEAMGLGVRQGANEESVHRAYDRRGGADPERERESRGGGEAGTFSEVPESRSRDRDAAPCAAPFCVLEI